MTEKDQPFVPNELPDFKQNWVKLRDNTPSFLMPRDWKAIFNIVYSCWRDYPEVYAKITADLRADLALEGISEKEREYTETNLKDLTEAWEAFKKGINQAVTGEKAKWGDIKKLRSLAEDLRGPMAREEEQSEALLEVVSELKKEGNLPKNFEQGAVESGFMEIFSVGEYRIIDYTAVDDTDDLTERTTQDSKPDEKKELRMGLKGKIWTPEQVKEMRKIYKAWKRVALSGENNVDTSVADDLDELWAAAWKGEGLKKKSVLHFLQLAEDIYQGLEQGGGLDIDLTEYQEEGDEEEDEEGN